MKRAGVCALVVATLAAITLGATACTTQYPLAPTISDNVIAASRESPGAPMGFNDDPARVSCGEITLGQGEKVPADSIVCFNDAIGTTDAELVVVSPTTEGDPIVTFYRTLIDGTGADQTEADRMGVAVFVDSSNDRYGSSTWTFENFPDATDISALSDFPAGWQ